MTNALAPVKAGSQEVAEYNPDTFMVPGMENVSPQELRIPILKLVQFQSKMDNAAAHLGEYHNSVTNEFSATPEALIIGVAKGRVMFPTEYNAENKPTCGSDNGKEPREEYIGKEIEQVIINAETGKKQINVTLIPDTCEGCPFAQWGVVEDQPPACSEVNTFAFVGEDGLPGIFQAKSTGMKAAAALKTLVASNGIRKTVRFASVKESKGTGEYYAPVFMPGPKPAKEWQQTALRLAGMGNFAERNQAAAVEMDYKSNGSHAPIDGEQPQADEFQNNDIPW